MKLLLPFVLSALIPGLGQMYIAKYWKGLLLLLVPVLTFFLLPTGFIFAYFILIIISLTDLYLTFEKTEGKRRVINNLIFGIIIAIFIIPALFYLFTLSIYKGGIYVKDEFLGEDYTKSEMEDIVKALNKYQIDTDTFPTDYSRFVRTKPIWDSWYDDYWGTAYRYTIEGKSLSLTSAGKDHVFGTDDDIVLTSSYQ